MNSYSLSHQGLANGYTLDQFKADFKVAYSRLGLTKRQHFFLAELMKLTSPQDYETGAICAVFYKVRNLSDIIPFSRETINGYERALTDWLIVTAPKRGRRSGERLDGKIQWAAGINLQPLVDRSEEVREAAKMARLNKAYLECLRGEILACRSALIDCGMLEMANSIFPRGRPSEVRKQSKLEQIRDQLRSALMGEKMATGTRISGDMTPKNLRPNTSPNQYLNSCTAGRRKRKRENLSFDVNTLKRISSNEFGHFWEQHGKHSDPLTALIFAAEEVFLSWGADSIIWQKALRQHDKCAVALCVFITSHNMQSDVNPKYFVRNPIGCFIGQLRTLGDGTLNITGLLAQIEKHARYKNVA